MNSERSGLVYALCATYAHIEELERIGADKGKIIFTSEEREQARRIVAAILAMDVPTLADCTPKQAPPVKTVSAETLRRLRKVIEYHTTGSGIIKSSIYVATAEKLDDHLRLSDLDEILAALEHKP